VQLDERHVLWAQSARAIDLLRSSAASCRRRRVRSRSDWQTTPGPSGGERLRHDAKPRATAGPRACTSRSLMTIAAAAPSDVGEHCQPRSGSYTIGAVRICLRYSNLGTARRGCLHRVAHWFLAATWANWFGRGAVASAVLASGRFRNSSGGQWCVGGRVQIGPWRLKCRVRAASARSR